MSTRRRKSNVATKVTRSDSATSEMSDMNGDVDETDTGTDSSIKTPKRKQFSSSSSSKSSSSPAPVQDEGPPSSFMKKVLTRTLTALVLSSFSMGMLLAGHLYCIMAMILTQLELYREMLNVRYIEAKERSIPWFRSLQWAWFIVPMIWVYGETLHKFCTEHRSLHHLTSITNNLKVVVAVLYFALFVVSVLTLKKGMMRFQLSQIMWSIVTVCIVVFQSKWFASNTLHGLFWFCFPMTCVIINDCSAYFSGICFGRKFIQAPFLPYLSPNKTWEGFIGAGIMTVIFAFLSPAILSQFSWITCPAEGLYFWPNPPALECIPNPVFIKTLIDLPFIGPTMIYPMQLHGISYGLFASIVAPFGGFFASAIKRAYRMKDFESFMPGHGGAMDRMDCQLLMITFTTFYYYAFIQPKSLSVEKMMFFASQMNIHDQTALWNELGKQIGM